MIDTEKFTTKFGKSILKNYFRVNPKKESVETIEEILETSIQDTKSLFNENNIISEKPIKKTKNKQQTFVYQEIKQPLIPTSILSEYDITRYMKMNNIVGEESLGSLLTIGIANKNHIILEGMSGSGKTYIIDRILNLLPKEKTYELQLSSKQAVWQQVDEINDAKVLFVPELQKAIGDRKNLSIIEFLKNITEGKDAKRIVTNASRNGILSYEIKSGKTIVTTIAKENDFKYDRETQRRFLVLETNSSKTHIKKIIDNKIKKYINIDVSKSKKTLEKDLSERIKYVQEMKNTYVINPFLNYMKQAFPIIEKTQSYLNHYLNLFDSWGKFFSPERKNFTIGENKFVLLNIQDIYNVFEMYQPHFIKTLENFNDGVSIDKFIPDWGDCYRNGIQTVKEDLEIKTDQGYVNVAQNFANLTEEWKNSQIEEDRIFINNYKTGKKEYIANINYSFITNPARLLRAKNESQ